MHLAQYFNQSKETLNSNFLKDDMLYCVKKSGNLKSDISEIMIQLTNFWPTFEKVWTKIKS